LPWRQGASSVGVAPSTVFNSRLGQATAGMSVAIDQGVLISFTMPVPPSGEGEIVNGELHLRWTMIARPPLGSLRPSGLRASTSAQAEREDDDPEARIAELVKRMTPAQRKTADSKIPQKITSLDRSPVNLAAPSEITSLPMRVARSAHPQVRAVPDPQKKAKDQQRLDALRAVWGNDIPVRAMRP